MPNRPIILGSNDIAKYPGRLNAALARRQEATPPSIESQELTAELAERVKHRAAQVRRGFVARPDADAPLPPMAAILRSGRGSAVRLRLFLSMLWIGSGPPHEISGVAAAWARLLDLDEPTTRGARQIRSAMGWLESRSLIDAAGKSGAGMTIRLRSDLGDDEPYEVPGRRIARARDDDLELDRKDLYFRLPETLWTHGWIHNLSGAALASLLILLEARRTSDPERTIWFSQRVAEDRYVISEETRGKGFAELAAFELIDVSMSPIQSDALGSVRTRHAYRIRDAGFDAVPWSVDVEPATAKRQRSVE